jgi:hypothetical protein
VGSKRSPDERSDIRGCSCRLRYYDTNLSKENCFVFTGDPNARPGVDLVTNPDGLVSNWCGGTIVAKAWFAFN